VTTLSTCSPTRTANPLPDHAQPGLDLAHPSLHILTDRSCSALPPHAAVPVLSAGNTISCCYDETV